MNKNDLKNIIVETIQEVLQERVNETWPPELPTKIKDKLTSRYGKDSPKTYATAWKIHNKGDSRVKEMWVAECATYGCGNPNDNHDEEVPVKEDYDDEQWRQGFQRPGENSALRKATKGNPRIYPCPTCKQPNRLTAKDKAKGYQCDSCADAEEGPM